MAVDDISQKGRVNLLYPSLNFSDLKVIGWGAGKEFKENSEKLGFNVDYTICIYEENWGRVINGIKVNPPEILSTENADKTLIIVFSSWWFDVFRQIKSIGNFKVIRAFSGWTPEHQKSYLLANEDFEINRRDSFNEMAFLFQGPIEVYTPMALKITKIIAPNIPIAFSTWNNSNPDILNECKKYVDFLLLNDMPHNSGPADLNTTRQQFGVIAGLEELKKFGFKYALKIRSDTSIYGQFDAEALIALTKREFPSNYGLASKILFSGLNSWRYIPYHLTDQYQFGEVDDLLSYWSFEGGIEISQIGRDEDFLFFSLSTPESAMLRSFLSRNSRQQFSKRKKISTLSLVDYWKLLIHEFSVLPESDLYFCKWKSISISDIIVEPTVGLGPRLMDPIDHSWVEKLPNLDIEEEVGKVLKCGFTISDFAGNKPIL